MGERSAKFAKQVYDIGDGATVTIRFDPERRPKMRHDDTIVIIGTHVCDGEPRRASRAEPSSNGPTEDTPELAALRANLEARHSKPFTSADAFREMGMDGVTGEELELLAASEVPVV